MPIMKQKNNRNNKKNEKEKKWEKKNSKLGGWLERHMTLHTHSIAIK